MKKLMTLVCGCLLVMVADACTGMYASKNVASDGSVLIGRTVDITPYNATMYQQICEYGVFHPINALQDVLPDTYTNDTLRTFGYDLNSVADAFRCLSAFTQSNRKWYGPWVCAYWRIAEVWRATEAGWGHSAGDTVALPVYTRADEEKSFADAKRIYDELLCYTVANNRIKGDDCDATNEPMDPFKPRVDIPVGSGE